MPVVLAPLVLAKDEAGNVVYLYQGTEVPQSIGKEERARLAEYLSAPVEGSDPERPAESGPGSAKDKWFAFAEFHGITVADDASKEDIIAAVTEAGK